MADLQAAADDPDLQAEFLDLSRQVHQAGGAKVPLHLGVFSRTAERLMAGVELGYNSPDEAATAFLQRNVYTFSAAKSKHQAIELTRLLLDDAGEVKPWRQFKKEALEAHQVYNVQWLEAEYEHAVASAQMAARWQEFEPDDLLSYETVGDDRVRVEHKAWDNISRPASDPWWDTHYPPNGWLCRCTVVADPLGKPTPRSVLPALPEPDSLFRHNVGKTGVIFPEEHNYFADLPDTDLLVVREAGNLRPVSRLLEFKRSWSPVRIDGMVTAQRAINKVHMLPAREGGALPVKFAPIPDRAQFIYDDGPQRMLVGNWVTDPVEIGLSLIHETGHYIDYNHLAPIGQLTRHADDSELWQVLKAVQDTPTVKRLNRMLYEAGYDTDLGQDIAYLVDGEELWARAYTQYIGEQSGDHGVVAELKRRAGLSIPTQWPDSEFGPVREAIHTLLESKQWLK